MSQVQAARERLASGTYWNVWGARQPWFDAAAYERDRALIEADREREVQAARERLAGSPGSYRRWDSEGWTHFDTEAYQQDRALITEAAAAERQADDLPPRQALRQASYEQLLDELDRRLYASPPPMQPRQARQRQVLAQHALLMLRDRVRRLQSG